MYKLLKKVNFHMFFNGVWFCCRIINLYLKELGQILVKRHLKTSFLNMRLTLIFVSLVLALAQLARGSVILLFIMQCYERLLAILSDCNTQGQNG